MKKKSLKNMILKKEQRNFPKI